MFPEEKALETLGIDPDSHGTVVNQGASSGSWPGATAGEGLGRIWSMRERWGGEWEVEGEN
ncbi:hypothetical protein INR49_016041 [Caranx melampygus]|nr:hypothetical protein INR49_016041 [Caranx melampygus]